MRRTSDPKLVAVINDWLSGLDYRTIGSRRNVSIATVSDIVNNFCQQHPSVAALREATWRLPERESRLRRRVKPSHPWTLSSPQAFQSPMLTGVQNSLTSTLHTRRLRLKPAYAYGILSTKQGKPMTPLFVLPMPPPLKRQRPSKGNSSSRRRSRNTQAYFPSIKGSPHWMPSLRIIGSEFRNWTASSIFTLGSSI